MKTKMKWWRRKRSFLIIRKNNIQAIERVRWEYLWLQRILAARWMQVSMHSMHIKSFKERADIVRFGKDIAFCLFGPLLKIYLQTSFSYSIAASSHLSYSFVHFFLSIFLSFPLIQYLIAITKNSRTKLSWKTIEAHLEMIGKK